ncbi:hypothetical protein MTO96_007305 [Rhipicephalus appendiculatus]
MEATSVNETRKYITPPALASQSRRAKQAGTGWRRHGDLAPRNQTASFRYPTEWTQAASKLQAVADRRLCGVAISRPRLEISSRIESDHA